MQSLLKWAVFQAVTGYARANRCLKINKLVVFIGLF